MPAVWAYSTAAPGKTCEDARLLGGGTKIQYPAGNNAGQAGWDIGLMFTNIGQLSERLRVVLEGQKMSRFALNLHGQPGAIDADSIGTEGAMYNFLKLWNKYSSQLMFINQMLGDGAAVLIMGCNVASGEVGAQFLMSLSSNVFKGHKVVGFTTIGQTLGQFRSGESCSEPGMRDTPYTTPSEGNPAIKNYREDPKVYLKLPWASETSEHAKVALDGEIISGAEKKPPTTEFAFQSYLPGTWEVRIGGWFGYFLFAKDGKAYWTDENSKGFRHEGKWWTMAGSIEWSFDDDPKGWKRNFQMLTPLQSVMNGNITIGGKPHGFFQMSKQV